VGILVAVIRTGKCPDISLETFSKVVESVYDCAFDPNDWPETEGVGGKGCASYLHAAFFREKLSTPITDATKARRQDARGARKALRGTGPEQPKPRKEVLQWCRQLAYSY
jgi:hypothetical protein